MQGIPTLKDIFENKDAIAAMLFCGAAVVGQLLHGVKKGLEGETSFVAWFTTGWKRTLAALIGNAAGMLMFVGTGVLGPILSLPNGWWALILFGFTNGFSADSALNKAVKAEQAKDQTAP